MGRVPISVDSICKVGFFKERNFLRKRLRIMDPNRHFDPAFKNGRWDGSYKFMNANGEFRIGLIYEVLRFLRKMKHTPVVKLNHRFTVKQFALRRDSQLSDPDKMLRPYQKECVKIMDRRILGVFDLATGSGKTEIILDYARCHPNASILYLCTKTLLARQTQDRARKYLDEDVTLLCGGNGIGRVRKLHLDRFVCGVDKTVSNLINTGKIKATDFDVVIVDECHHVKAKTLFTIVEFLKWKRLFGFTGSYPTEKRNLVSHWAVKEIIGPPLYRKTEKDLNAEYSDFFPETRVYRVMNTLHGYGGATGHAIYQRLKRDYERNQLIANISRQLGKGVLIIVNHKDHGRALEKLLANIDVQAEFIDASQGRERCHEAIRDLDRGNIPVLIATPVIEEGISVNNIAHIVNAAAFKSELQVIQRVGRGRRKKTRGANRLFIWDFADQGQNNCARNSRQRFAVYNQITDNVDDVTVFGLGELIQSL